MKKFFVLSLLLFFLLGIVKEADACDPGWTSFSLYGQSDGYGCKYDIDFCYKCSPTGWTDLDIKIEKIYSHGTCYPNTNDVLQTLLNKLYELCTMPNCSNPNAWLLVTVETPLCWEFHQKCWDENGSWAYFNWVETCNSGALCVSTCEICADAGVVYIRNPWSYKVGSCPDTNPHPGGVPECLNYETGEEGYTWPECIQLYPCP